MWDVRQHKDNDIMNEQTEDVVNPEVNNSPVVVSYEVIAHNVKAYKMSNGKIKTVRLMSKDKCIVQYYDNILDVYRVFGVYHYNTDRKG